jgi:hypothetical protein
MIGNVLSGKPLVQIDPILAGESDAIKKTKRGTLLERFTTTSVETISTSWIPFRAHIMPAFRLCKFYFGKLFASCSQSGQGRVLVRRMIVALVFK